MRKLFIGIEDGDDLIEVSSVNEEREASDDLEIEVSNEVHDLMIMNSINRKPLKRPVKIQLKPHPAFMRPEEYKFICYENLDA